jgi:muramoyltetrapeptide carboxypeptidase
MIDRRDFIFAAAASGLAFAANGRERLIKPPRVRPGDKVGLVNPATAAFDTQTIEIMVDALESLGLEVELGANYYDRHGYFAGVDEARASDINGFYRRSDIRMIVARGGWGSARLLPLLDYDAIKADPKVLLGYSDTTAILNGIHARTGIVTFHGPSPLDVFSADHFRRVIMESEAVTMKNYEEIDQDRLVQTEHRYQTIKGGKASGHILGGNLTVLTAIMGSDYLPDFEGSILFLEDVDEAVYRVDRMLTQLALAGVLEKISGFVFGRCTDCGSGGNFGSLTLEDVLREHVEPLGIPAFTGSMIGHIDKQFTVPLGIDVEMDADAGTIRMLESAVL